MSDQQQPAEAQLEPDRYAPPYQGVQSPQYDVTDPRHPPDPGTPPTPAPAPQPR